MTLQEEYWDSDAERFRHIDLQDLEFEHSLISLSKWEAKHHKLFLTPDEKTDEEAFDYLCCMLLTPDVDPEVLNHLTESQIKQINEYINDPMTGSTVTEPPRVGPRTSERLSSELIYFWMSQFQIDMACEHWHLNRLFTLIKIHHAKSQKQQKVPRQKSARTMAEINAARRAQLGTSG